MAPSTDPIYESPPPPRFSVDPAALPPQLKLTDVQQKMYDEVLQHFEKADYTIPDEENSALTEEEKFWLVRFGGTTWHGLLTGMHLRVLSVCYGTPPV